MLRKKLASWSPAFLMALFILFMSSQANPPGGGLFAFIPNSDKLAHMTEYFIFASFIYIALRRGHNIKNSRAIFAAILVASVYGITDELHQRFIPGRSTDVLDWAADAIGSMIVISRKMEDSL